MRKETPRYFSTGSFSKLLHTTRHTLYHYDSLGLLKPSHREENGYRCYGLEQADDYYLISLLREAGIPLDEIGNWMCRKDPFEISQLLAAQDQALSRQIHKLESIQSAIRHKRQLLEGLSTAFSEEVAEEVQCTELLAVSGMQHDSDAAALATNTAAFLASCDKAGLVVTGEIGGIYALPPAGKGKTPEAFRLFTTLCGPARNPHADSSYISGTGEHETVSSPCKTKPILSIRSLNRADAAFERRTKTAIATNNHKPMVSIVKKATGRFLVTHHRGSHETIPIAYRRLYDHAMETGPTPCGPFYEMMQTLCFEMGAPNQPLYKISLAITD